MFIAILDKPDVDDDDVNMVDVGLDDAMDDAGDGDDVAMDFSPGSHLFSDGDMIIPSSNSNGNDGRHSITINF